MSSARPLAAMRSPGCTPTVSPSGTASTTPSRKPTTCTVSDANPSRLITSQVAPTPTRGPCDSMSRPTVRMTRPLAGIVSIRSTCLMYRDREKAWSAVVGSMDTAVVLSKERPRDLLNLCIHAGIDDAHVGFHAAAAPPDAGVGHEHDVGAGEF